MEISEWSAKYESLNTKWDLGASPEPLAEFIRRLPPKQSVLIPGCGRGYEIASFHEAGHLVTAIDFSPAAIAAAREAIGHLADSIFCADFFRPGAFPEGPFDLCYERAFLCAIAPRDQKRYAERMAALLKPEGLLVGVIPYGSLEKKGPPTPIRLEERAAILETHFELVSDSPCPSKLRVLEGFEERWQLWRSR